ncbi:FkbM family methyltransferase [Acuticoccus sp.]|uniref:FkbM family methyltransferase n=1 Tax=Acuticoccus sp. TaxID=1904378 RepID=UPI003B5261B3
MILTETLLPQLYRLAMRGTGRHGARSLGRLNAAVFPHGQRIRLAGGEGFFVPPDPHFFGYVIGHEDHVAEVIAHEVRPGDVCFDVGANIGYFAVQMAAKAGPAGRVVAYEVEHTNIAHLRRNAQLAAAHGLTIDVVHAAVSNAAGTLMLRRGAASTLHTVVRGEDASADALTSVSIDDEVDRLGLTGPVGLIKVDVEGHEPFVLEGMRRTVEDGRIRAMIVEVSSGRVAEEVDAQLRAFGRRVARVTAWVDGAWRERSLTALTHHTDVLVAFR